MGCPEPITLSRHADGDLEGAEARQVARHVAGCATCRSAVEAEAALGAGLARAVCPEPELLALFIDEALPAERADLVAGHVLACAPCRDVVAWTREAAAVADKRTSGRRRRAAPAARVLRPSWAPGFIGAAAAASILFMVAVSFQRTPAPATDQANAPRPRTERTATPPRASDPRPTTTAPRRATEAATEAPRPTTDAATEAPATEAPLATEAPRPATEAPATERPATEVRPGTERAGTQAPAVREPAPIEVAAVPGARPVRWRDAQGEGEVTGVRALRPGTRLLGGRGGGALRVGSAELRLEPQAATRLTTSDDDAGEGRAGEGRPRMTLEDGELTLEAARADVEVACGPVVIRPAPEGVFLSLASDGADHVVVCCMSGQASLGGAGVPAGVVRPGDAVRVGREGARPARRDPRLAKAEEAAVAVALATGLDAPRGVRLAKLIEEAARDLEATDPTRRAWAAYALLTARTDRDPKPTPAQLATAATALAQLAGRTDLAPEAAVPTLLGCATSADGKDDEPLLTRLAAAIAARPPAELLLDTDALLALRVVERRTAWRAPRALWAVVAGAPIPTGAEGWAPAARAALVRPLELAERRNALAALDARLVPGPALEAGVVLEAARALALLDPGSEARRTALLARAAETPRDPRLAVALSLDAGALLGERTAAAAASAPASVVARRLEDGRWRVTFVFRTGRRPKAPTLHGSWDTWAAPGAPLRERPDGSFSATLLLPAGRHEYKVRLAEGAQWEHDPGNPLTALDGQGGLNSVVILE